jgi:transposase
MATSPHRWSTKKKSELVLQLLRGANAGELAREHGISQAQLYSWRDQFLEGGRAALKVRRDRQDSQTKQVSALERKVGQLTMENEILKKSIHRIDRR